MESRNLILAIILSVGVLFIWSFFFEAPEQEVLNGDIINGDVSEVNSNELNMEAIDEIEKSLGITEGDTIGLQEALTESERVLIETDSLAGSINLKGLRIDDIILKKYYRNTFKIPMIKNSRSLNLSNAVAVVAFEAWKQLKFSSTSSQDII